MDGYIAPIGHAYSASYKWDGENCTVTIVCTNEEGAIKHMAPATVNETARVEAEVGKAGVRTLVATIE